MREAPVPAWVARLPRYRMESIVNSIAPSADSTGAWVRYADLVAACPPPQDYSTLEAQERSIQATSDVYMAGYEAGKKAASPPPGEALSAVVEDAISFLRHVEWNDRTSEVDASDLATRLEAALPTPAPARQEPT